MTDGRLEPAAGDRGLVDRLVRHPAARWLPVAVVAATFVHALATSWRKWGNLLSDGGRELELPRKLLEGGELYRTVRNLYGPLPAWINAGLYAAFGIHLDVLVAAGIVTAAVMTLAIYALADRFVGRWIAAAVAIWFVYVSAFGHIVENPSFNFVIPYAYAAIYGITAATLSLLFVVRHLQRGRDADLCVSLVFAAVTALCKIEPTLAVVAAHAVVLGGSAAAGLLTRRRLLLYAGTLAAVVAVYGALTIHVGPGLWSDNVLSAANVSIRAYVRGTMGLDDVARSLRAIGNSALLLAGAAFAGWGSARIAEGAGRRARAASIAVAAAAAVLLLAVGAWMDIEVSLRALPVLAVVALGAFALAFLRNRERRPALLAHLAVWAFAAGCLSRLLLFSIPYHYGFYLTPIPVLGAFAVLTGRANGALGIREWPRASALPAIGLFAGIAAACLVISRGFYAQHTVPIETPRGKLLLLPGGRSPPGLMLLSTLPADAKVITVPIGTGLVFLSGRRWGDSIFNYLPTDLAGSWDDASLVRRWSADPPDAVLYFANDMTEFGYTSFGIDYGRRALAWLDENYVVASDPWHGLVLLRRREAGPDR